MIHTVVLDEVRPQPWRNGGGSTQELLTWPTAADWLVRISVACIERDGPFSAYPGIERWFAVVSGDGVFLRFSDEPLCLTAETTPLRFDGVSAPDCQLRGGATRDLNLMVRADAAHGAMRRVSADVEWHSDAALRAVFTADETTLLVDAELRVSLAAGSLAWSDTAAGERWRIVRTGTEPRAFWMEARSRIGTPEPNDG